MSSNSEGLNGNQENSNLFEAKNIISIAQILHASFLILVKNILAVDIKVKKKVNKQLKKTFFASRDFSFQSVKSMKKYGCYPSKKLWSH